MQKIITKTRNIERSKFIYDLFRVFKLSCFILYGYFVRDNN